MKTWLKFLSWLFTLFIIFSLLVIYWVYQVVTPLNTNQSANLKVEPGTTGGVIAAKLGQKKIISSPLTFRLLLRVSGRAGEIKCGYYRFSSNSSIVEIMKKLLKGEVENQMVTFPEGLTIKQIGLVLEKADIVSQNEFADYAHNLNFEMADQKLHDAEGFLLPETYQLPLGISKQDVVSVMQKEFSRQILPEFYTVHPELDIKSIVTLASLVEREAKVAEERPIIAGVYLNRLKKGMNLECDATIQYALGEVKPELALSDLKIDSPYNTYLHPGLPPGPICNPGKAAIFAVLHPQKNDFLFYVLNYDKNDGSHVFSRTFREHVNNINRFRR